MNSRWKVISRHPEDLADGRSVEPGATFELTSEQMRDPHNLRLQNAGRIKQIPERTGRVTKDQLKDRAKELGIAGRHRMNADQLQTAIHEATAPPPELQPPAEGDGEQAGEQETGEQETTTDPEEIN